MQYGSQKRLDKYDLLIFIMPRISEEIMRKNAHLNNDLKELDKAIQLGETRIQIPIQSLEILNNERANKLEALKDKFYPNRQRPNKEQLQKELELANNDTLIQGEECA